MLEKYKKYLELISTRLIQKHFEEQKDYIFCKEGCSYCCESGQYPFSEVEYKYAMLGYEALDEEQKNIIQKKIKKIKAEKSDNENFMYECPFLINKKCSIYNYRGIICRTHGLLFYENDGNGNLRNKIPNCVHLGLNYSNVYDKQKKTITPELMEEMGITTKPVAYNLSLKTLTDNGAAKTLELEFGEIKPLIEWF